MALSLAQYFTGNIQPDHPAKMELAALASMHIAEFDYQLPADLIAQQPLEQRDASRMLLVNRDTQTWNDSQFALLPDYLRASDLSHLPEAAIALYERRRSRD